jgi:hypothetical protein
LGDFARTFASSVTCSKMAAKLTAYREHHGGPGGSKEVATIPAAKFAGYQIGRSSIAFPRSNNLHRPTIPESF